MDENNFTKLDIQDFDDRVRNLIGGVADEVATVPDFLRAQANAPQSTPNNVPQAARNYTGNSIVDFLNLSGQDSSFSARKNLATNAGITDYRGTAEQNTQLLNTLRGSGGNAGVVTTPAPAPKTASPQTFTTPSGAVVDAGGRVVSTPDATELARQAAGAGLSLSQYQDIIERNANPTPEERKQIADDLGISELEAVVFRKPDKSSEELYNQLFDQAGLAEVRRRMDDLDKRIQRERALFNEAIGEVNENPFLTEKSRVGRGRRVLEQFESKIGNMQSRFDSLANLYNDGVAQIDNILTLNRQDFADDQAINQAKLNYLKAKEETRIADLVADKTVEGTDIETFLSSQTPETIGTASTGYYRYDPQTKQFVQIIAPTSGGGTGSGTGTLDANFTFQDGEEINLATVDGIKRLVEREGATYAEIFSFLDTETKLTTTAIKEILAEAGLKPSGEGTISADDETLRKIYLSVPLEAKLETLGKTREDFAKFFQSRATEEEAIEDEYETYLEEELLPYIQTLRDIGLSEEDILKKLDLI